MSSWKDTTLEVKNLKKNNLFLFQKSQLENCNVFIVTAPIPVNIKSTWFGNLHEACKLLGKIIVKGPNYFWIYSISGISKVLPAIEKFSKLKFNKDFLGYSPERTW